MTRAYTVASLAAAKPFSPQTLGERIAELEAENARLREQLEVYASRPGPKPRSVKERFWGFVDVRGPDDCWEWNGARKDGGYGLFKFRRGMCGAHRVSWHLANGDIAPGLLVCHRCDNPPCVNPAHLFVGTHLDNMADMSAKGRHSKMDQTGENNGNARLTEPDVREIRRLAGITPRSELANRYGVGETAIYRVQVGRAWASVK